MNDKTKPFNLLSKKTLNVDLQPPFELEILLTVRLVLVADLWEH